MEHHIDLPLTRDKTGPLRAGDTVYLTGTIYTARDAAHKRLVELLDQGEALPFDPRGAVIYYVGPTPAPPGRPVGSAGPTTSYRMDAYAPTLLGQGVLGMIGKGVRAPQVVEAMVAQGAVYFAAIGGAGALLASRIQQAQVIAFDDLGPEAVHRLEVRDFPVVVAVDSQGDSLYVQGRQAYLRSLEAGRP